MLDGEPCDMWDSYPSYLKIIYMFVTSWIKHDSYIQLKINSSCSNYVYYLPLKRDIITQLPCLAKIITPNWSDMWLNALASYVYLSHILILLNNTKCDTLTYVTLLSSNIVHPTRCNKWVWAANSYLCCTMHSLSTLHNQLSLTWTPHHTLTLSWHHWTPPQGARQTMLVLM